jgi:hypothetical protein
MKIIYLGLIIKESFYEIIQTEIKSEESENN